MDYLPSDVTTHILSFLPGKDVIRFKQLNKCTRNIISTCRSCLNCPEMTIKLSDGNFYSNNDERMILSLQFNTVFSWFAVNFSNHVAIVMDKSLGSRQFDDFLSSFFEREDGNRRLLDLLNFILERCDVADLRLQDLSKPYGTDALSEALKRSHAKILKVTVDHTDFVNQTTCEILKTVANSKKQSIEYPSLSIICNGKQGQFAPNLRKINEISSLYKSSSVYVKVRQTIGLMEEIMETWRSDPFEKFAFDIVVHTYNASKSWKGRRSTRRLEQMFTITQTNGQYFEFCVPPRIRQQPSIRMEDSASGKIVQFDQTPLKEAVKPCNDEDPDGLVKISITVFKK